MFKKFSLNAKLISMFTLCSLILLSVGFIGANALSKTTGFYNHVTDINMPNSSRVQTMAFAATELTKWTIQLTLPGNDEKEQNRIAEKIQESFRIFEKNDKEYQSIEFVEGEEAIYNDFTAKWNAVKKSIEDDMPLARSSSPADHLAFSNLWRAKKDMRADFYKASDKLVEFHANQASTRTQYAKEFSTNQTRLTAAIVFAGFIISLLMGILFSRSLSKQLASVSANLVEGSTQVNSAATEIAASSESLSGSATEQSAAVQQTSSAVVELSTMVVRNSDNAEKSKEKAVLSQQVAQRGREVVTDMTKAIYEINESNNNIMKAVEESNKKISDISKVIMDIGSKTNVIKDIVFQTKLLSFNASVEAARAGEHGKGFSVVAEEVGNLAQMSGNAAQEISATLEESIKKVEDIVSDTKQLVERLVLQGKEKVDKGHTIAEQCGEILEQIVAEASDVSSMVIEITNSSKEQSVGIQEITKAMSQMDTVTQQNAGVSQTAASASVELAAQAESLNTLVAEMQKIIYGVKETSYSAPRPVKSSHQPERHLKSVKLEKSLAKSGLSVPSYHDIKASGE